MINWLKNRKKVYNEVDEYEDENENIVDMHQEIEKIKDNDNILAKLEFIIQKDGTIEIGCGWNRSDATTGIMLGKFLGVLGIGKLQPDILKVITDASQHKDVEDTETFVAYILSAYSSIINENETMKPSEVFKNVSFSK